MCLVSWPAIWWTFPTNLLIPCKSYRKGQTQVSLDCFAQLCFLIILVCFWSPNQPRPVIMDAIVFGKTGIPDLRFDTYNNPVAEIFAPEWTRKSWIKKKLSGENPYEEYDNPQYLCNMYMEKPDWDQPHMKMFYSFVAGVNLGKILKDALHFLFFLMYAYSLLFWMPGDSQHEIETTSKGNVDCRKEPFLHG